MRQCEAVQKSQAVRTESLTFNVGDPCYARYHGRVGDRTPRWVPATVVKVRGGRSFDVRVAPTGPIWRRHVEQLQRRFATDEDAEPGENVPVRTQQSSVVISQHEDAPEKVHQPKKVKNPRVPQWTTYSADQPRTSSRLQGKRVKVN